MAHGTVMTLDRRHRYLYYHVWPRGRHICLNCAFLFAKWMLVVTTMA